MNLTGRKGTIFASASLFSDAKLLGYLNTATTIEGRIYAVVFRMSEVLFPLFSQLGSESLAQKADKLMRSSWLLTTLAVAAPTIAAPPIARTDRRFFGPAAAVCGIPGAAGSPDCNVTGPASRVPWRF